MSEIDKGLTPAIDANRDLLLAGSARQALNGLLGLLASLPSGASQHLSFRIKANIAHCHLQLGEKDDAYRWFDDAVASDPTEPRAIATQAYVKLVRGDMVGAFDFAKAQLAIDPSNEYLAAHLIEAALFVRDGANPEALIPAALRDRERVLIARCVLYRTRGEEDAWQNLARLGASRFPANATLKLLAAEADVEQIAHVCRGAVYRPISAAERSRLKAAADSLEARWIQLKESEVPARDDCLAALNAAMIARTLLDEREKALSLARDLVARTDDVQGLTMAAQMAQILGDDAIAAMALAKLPDEGPPAFLKAIAAANRRDWAAGAAHLAKAEIPQEERAFADMIIRLGDIDAMDETTAHRALTDAVQRYSEDARALILVACMAEQKRQPELANEAYRAATAHIGPRLHHAARVMIASHAYRSDDFDIIIRALDGHIETGSWSRVLQWLADAHASEQPPRRRNLRFFDRLPSAVRDIPSIARAHASKLLDLEMPDKAEPILFRVVAHAPDDVFSQLKLVQALDELDRSDEAKAIVRAAAEASMKGPTIYLLQWAHRLREADLPQRALAYAYDLLRSNSTNYRMALGYVALVFADRTETIIPAVDEVADECWVTIENSAGERDAFMIDEGPAFLGIDVVPASHGRAQRVIGLRVGGSVDAPARGGAAVTWTVQEIKSKYLAVLHTVMETFERRFPTANGLWRIELKGDDLQPVLDVVRDQAKAKQETTQRFYVANRVPLAFAARAIGTDVMSFASYLRATGFEVVTAGGSADEIQAGIDTAQEYRGAGATLDTYTAVTAAEMGCLDALRGWFGKLAVPASAVAMVDRLLHQARDSLGKEAMSISWKDGQFFREDINDEVLSERVLQLEAVKRCLLEYCEIAAFVVPDDLTPEVAEFARTNGREGIDAMYLAASRGEVLVSDDLFYRQMANAMTQVDGTWLQVVLLNAHASGQIDRARYATACARLAVRRHGNLWIDDAALLLISEECTDAEFAAVCHYIGTPNADMNAHTRLVGRFISRIWQRSSPPLKCEALTSAVVSALLRHRKTDWYWHFALLWLGLEGRGRLESYLSCWVRGHFLPVRPIIAALQQWRRFFGQLEPVSAVSRRAMQADGWPLSFAGVDLGITPHRASTTKLNTRPNGTSAAQHVRRQGGKRWRRRHRMPRQR